MRVVVTGGTGVIGRAIAHRLARRGDQVVVVARHAGDASGLPEGTERVTGDVQYAGPWQDVLAGADAVVHLAGLPVGGRRWNARYKQLIHDSRVDGTARVVEGIAAVPDGERPRVLVSASGTDYYPHAEDLDAHTAKFEDDPVPESSPPGSSFMARVCRHWEGEARAAEALGLRVVLMRTGTVLSARGALRRLVPPFKWFVGGRLGSGRQWTSWIALDDVARAYLFAVDHGELAGPVNLVAPENARNADLARALGQVLHRPAWLPVPSFAVKLVGGELAEYVLHGRRAVPAALQAAGFEFEHPELRSAIRAALASA